MTKNSTASVGLGLRGALCALVVTDSLARVSLSAVLAAAREPGWSAGLVCSESPAAAPLADCPMTSSSVINGLCK